MLILNETLKDIDDKAYKKYMSIEDKYHIRKINENVYKATIKTAKRTLTQFPILKDLIVLDCAGFTKKINFVNGSSQEVLIAMLPLGQIDKKQADADYIIEQLSDVWREYITIIDSTLSDKYRIDNEETVLSFKAFLVSNYKEDK